MGTCERVLDEKRLAAALRNCFYGREEDRGREIAWRFFGQPVQGDKTRVGLRTFGFRTSKRSAG